LELIVVMQQLAMILSVHLSTELSLATRTLHVPSPACICAGFTLVVAYLYI
jgi:hypothetical protein